MGFALTYLCRGNICVPGAQEGQNRVLDPEKSELQVGRILSHSAGKRIPGSLQDQ